MGGNGGKTQSPRQGAIAKGHDKSPHKNRLHWTCVRIEDYIAAVERVELIYETQHAHHKPISGSRLITALRKVWNGAEYDSKTAGKKWLAQRWYSFKSKKTQFYSPFDAFLYDVRDWGRLDPALTVDWAGKKRDWKTLVGVRCVYTKAHKCIDFGHVLTGLDACVNCRKVHQILKDEINSKRSLQAAVTWSGDIGLLYKDMLEEKPENFDTMWDECCHPDDLLGDVDGIVLGTLLANKGTGGFQLSKELRNYYLSNKWTQRKIFEKFNAGYNGRAARTDFIRKYVKEFVDAASIGYPSFDDALLNKCVNRWRDFVLKGLAGQAQHDCQNDKLEDDGWRGTSTRFTFNGTRNGAKSPEFKMKRPTLKPE